MTWSLNLLGFGNCKPICGWMIPFTFWMKNQVSRKVCNPHPLIQWRNQDFFQVGQMFQNFPKISGKQTPLFGTPMKGRMIRCFGNKRYMFINVNLSINKTITLMVTASNTMLLFYFTESPYHIVKIKQFSHFSFYDDQW